jgi:hypothetical protein
MLNQRNEAFELLNQVETQNRFLKTKMAVLELKRSKPGVENRPE